MRKIPDPSLPGDKEKHPQKMNCADRGSRMSADKEGQFFSRVIDPRPRSVIIEPGDTLMDRFRIKNLLAEGRFGSVFRAEDQLRSTDVALKIVSGPANNDISMLLKHEAKLNGGIFDHKHVIRLYDLHAITVDGTELLFLSMEYADNGTFRSWLLKHKNNLEVRKTIGLDFFKQACRGVAAIHGAGAAHLDLKPENLLFSGNTLKVTDFGASRAVQSLTQSDRTCCKEEALDIGTPPYMSPEHFIRAHPDDLDLRTDVYSMGIIFYELFHPKCRPPFGGPYTLIRDHHLSLSPPALPEAGIRIARIIDRCLEKNPDDRYQNMTELINDLERQPIHGNRADIKTEDVTETPCKVEEMWENAKQCYSKRNFNKALKLIDEVTSIQPNHSDARLLREELERKFEQVEQLYRDTSNNIDNRDLSYSVEILKEAVEIYPDHPSGAAVQVKIKSMSEHFKKLMDQGSRNLSENNLESALHNLLNASQIDSTNDKTRCVIEALSKIKELRVLIFEAITDEKFEKALHLARCVDVQLEELALLKNRGF